MNSTVSNILKFVIALALGVGLFFAAKHLMGGNSSDGTSDKETDIGTPSPTSSESEGVASFSYVPPVPVNGSLKGVVELGATGFNSFIVRIDGSKNWKLEKADFGNSLVLENIATDMDIREGLKKYIGGMLDYGVQGKQIHFIVSSGAAKADVTQKIVKNLKSMNYFVNTVNPEQEAALALNCVLPRDYEGEAFVVDIGSGNTKVSWKKGTAIEAFETYGSKYFQEGKDDGKVQEEIKVKAANIPSLNTKTCFIIGGVPFKMAKEVRNEKERFTVLRDPSFYKFEEAKEKSGVVIYKALREATGCQNFVFDWDANFSIGYLLSL